MMKKVAGLLQKACGGMRSPLDSEILRKLGRVSIDGFPNAETSMVTSRLRLPQKPGCDCSNCCSKYVSPSYHLNIALRASPTDDLFKTILTVCFGLLKYQRLFPANSLMASEYLKT